MANVKTAISIDKTLFEQVDKLAGELAVSRSSLFVLAVEEFIRRYENEQLLQQLNQAYADMPSTEETQLLKGIRSHHQRQVEGKW